LVKDLGADVNWMHTNGATALYLAAQEGKICVARCLVKELGADVNKTRQRDGATSFFIAALKGHLAMVRCLVEELGAAANRGLKDGSRRDIWLSHVAWSRSSVQTSIKQQTME
jgi:ankyrin repeat protein